MHVVATGNLPQIFQQAPDLELIPSAASSQPFRLAEPELRQVPDRPASSALNKDLASIFNGAGLACIGAAKAVPQLAPVGAALIGLEALLNTKRHQDDHERKAAKEHNKEEIRRVSVINKGKITQEKANLARAKESNRFTEVQLHLNAERETVRMQGALQYLREREEAALVNSRDREKNQRLVRKEDHHYDLELRRIEAGLADNQHQLTAQRADHMQDLTLDVNGKLTEAHQRSLETIEHVVGRLAKTVEKSMQLSFKSQQEERIERQQLLEKLLPKAVEEAPIDPCFLDELEPEIRGIALSLKTPVFLEGLSVYKLLAGAPSKVAGRQLELSLQVQIGALAEEGAEISKKTVLTGMILVKATGVEMVDCMRNAFSERGVSPDNQRLILERLFTMYTPRIFRALEE